MSILKRRPCSLDPAEKQKRNRHTEHFALIEKCLQIPSDDKMILRKNVEEQDESLASILEKYRKEGNKDMKQLQIYLRKYIQRYKSDHPKYPTLKLAARTESCQFLPKRSSLSFSVTASKATQNFNHSNLQNLKDQRYSQETQMAFSRQSDVVNSFACKKQPSSPLRQQRFFGLKQKPKKNPIPTMNLNTTSFYKDQEKNYEAMIKKRKTEKLKIQANRVSVVIENQSHTLSHYNDLMSPQQKNANIFSSIAQKESVNDSGFKVNSSLLLESGCNKQSQKSSKKIEQRNFKQIDSCQFGSGGSSNVIQSIQEGQLLSSISFKMKVDESEDIERNFQDKFGKKLQIKNARRSITEALINLDQSFGRQSVFGCQQVKRKLFECQRKDKSISGSQNLQYSDSDKFQSKDLFEPFGQINVQNNRLALQESRHNASYCGNQLPLSSSKKLREKENFNSGRKSKVSQLSQSVAKSESLIFSNVKSSKNQNINSLSTINKDTEQNEVMSSYMNSHRKTNQMMSHRLLQDSRSFVKSFIKEKQERQVKETKSSRMQFSHRMDEVISGRKESQVSESVNSQQAVPSYSCRDKHKGASKLEFWARIQSTINE